MTIVLRSIQIKPPLTDELNQLGRRAAQILGLVDQPSKVRILRKALDSRTRRNIHYTYSLALDFEDPALEASLAGRSSVESFTTTPQPQPSRGAKKLDTPPVIIGAGPAGLFAALLLARNGYCPRVVERGSEVITRTKRIRHFLNRRQIHPNDNYLYGEGGAGTYSDGKLTTRTKSPWRQWVLDTFVEFGAPEDIAYLTRAHIGSDNLPDVVAAIREEIKSLGGTFLFNHTAKELLLTGSAISGVTLEGKDSIPAQTVILAPGGSARNLYANLLAQGVTIEAKPFQMGLRIEHPQGFIDRWKFSGQKRRLDLPSGEYFLSIPSAPERIHSFCMCPGGTLMPTVEREGLVCTNGMSRYERDGKSASSALVITVHPEQFGSGPLAGVEFQTAIEEAAWAQVEGKFRAPCQTAADFLAGEVSAKPVKSTYPFEVVPTDLRQLMPPNYAQSLRNALGIMEKRIKGFASESAVLVWPESRASCPVRIPRDPESLQSISTAGLFPAGEGAGYAGGIMSSALDGLQAASKLVEIFAPVQ